MRAPVESISKNPHALKLMLLIGTGLPGVTKLMAIYFVQLSAGSEVLGKLLSDLNIISMFTFFTAIGWASLLIIRVAMEKDRLSRYQIFNGILLKVIPVFFLSLVVILVMQIYSIFHYLDLACLYLFVYSVYQLTRHFYFGCADPRSLFILEVVIAALTITYGIFASLLDLGLLAVFVAPILFATLIDVFFWQVSLKQNSRKFFGHLDLDSRKAYEFGFANLASGGVYMLLVPIVGLYLSPSYSALVGVLVTLIGFVLIVSRTFTNFYLPVLAKLRSGSDNTSSVRLVAKFRLLSMVAIALLSSALVMAWLAFAPTFINEIASLDGTLHIFLLMLACTAIGQVFLPDAAIIVTYECGRLSAILNGLALLGVVVVSAGLFFIDLPGLNKIYALLLSLFTIQCIKGAYMFANTKRIIGRV